MVVVFVLLIIAALGHVLLPAAVRMLLVVPEGDGIAQGPVAFAQVHVVNVHFDDNAIAVGSRVHKFLAIVFWLYLLLFLL